MTKYSERVMMIRGDWRVLRLARNHRSYAVQNLRDGVWTTERNGPWDYYANARARLRAIVGHAVYER